MVANVSHVSCMHCIVHAASYHSSLTPVAIPDCMSTVCIATGVSELPVAHLLTLAIYAMGSYPGCIKKKLLVPGTEMCAG